MDSTTSSLNRRAVGAFFLALFLAAVWFRLNLGVSGLAAGPVPWRLVLLLVSNAVFLYGLWEGLKRASFSPSTRLAAWCTVALVLVVWLALIWMLAANGIFQRSIGAVPVLPLAIFVPVVIGSLVLARWKAIARLLDATPVSWLVGLQVYRILGGAFIVYWIHGTMPGVFALPAGVGDVLVGLLSLPAAIWVASDRPIGKRIGVRWNVLGLTDFVVAITWVRDFPRPRASTLPRSPQPPACHVPHRDDPRVYRPVLRAPAHSFAAAIASKATKSFHH